MDLRTQLRRSAGYFSERPAVVHDDRRLTFQEAWSRGLRLANALIAMGLRPGDRIATLEDNSIEAADIFLAAAAGNFVRVPLYARNRQETHRHMIAGTECKLVLVSERYHGEVSGLDAQLPCLERIIVRGPDYESWLAGFPDDDPDPPVSPEDFCVIRHTGGTTGLPKGVGYRHRTWLSAARGFYRCAPPLQMGDGVLHIGPLAHGSGYMFSPAWAAGARNVMMSSFEPEALLDVLEAEEIAYMFLAPTILSAIVNCASARHRSFPHMKMILSTSAPVSDRTALLARELFGPNVLYQGYGQTEALPIAMMGPADWFGDIPGSTPMRACGRVLEDVDIEIRDDAGRLQPPNQPGEILVRIENRQMEGFWNDPAESARRLINGWVRTGDIGKIDENGFLYLLDRSNDVIISGGFNIYPAELENVIAEHPAVRAVAVVGVPHEKWGETPLAIIVTDPGARVEAADIIALVSRRLGSMKKPSDVIFRTEALPVSSVGKVMRAQLRKPFWEGRSQRVSGS